MIKNFQPKMNILPEAQKKLWAELKPSTELGFVLYGGTAIALRLGHRESVDFDFFTEKNLDHQQLQNAFSFLKKSTVIQNQPNTLSVLAPYKDSLHENVKVSFFGGIQLGRIGNPEMTKDNNLEVASLEDLMSTKLKVILQRVESKDYKDISAMIQNGVSLPLGLSGAREMFGLNFQPSESLKALVYFEDGDLHILSQNEKNILIKAAKSVKQLPPISILNSKLSLI